MKFIIAVLLSTFFLTSCAHHHKNPEHHHHAYEKRCAYSVAHGNLDVEGVDKYKMDHAGKTYYFSTDENMKEFVKDIEKNVKEADMSWAGRKR